MFFKKNVKSYATFVCWNILTAAFKWSKAALTSSVRDNDNHLTALYL